MNADRPTENRLAAETSPYLLLHKTNPVDWYPWGAEALARAKQEDKPIFLSVGYSTCYWCHVMERESFSDPAMAERMNRDFVCIKVDREERPDLDEIFMLATQILSHHGGWPNSVFLTPALEPFFAGTYFPPRDIAGRPGFMTVLDSLNDAWHNRRQEVEEQAREVAGAMHRYLAATAGSTGADTAPLPIQRVLADLERQFDDRWGGFGAAPKFPTPANLLLLLEVAEEEPASEPMLAQTLDAMARGGIFDQLAGGFHRYSTDRQWLVPHFEKMLYDNGLLLEIYARQWQRTGDPEAARIARQTAEFLTVELTAPEGAFWSAIDAESDGREGAYYVWQRQELETVLGEEDFGFLAPLFGFSGPPSFEDDRYVLHLPEKLEDQARRRRLSTADLLAQIRPLRETLLGVRNLRRRPPTDDKILADWNGLAISGLAVAGRLLRDRELIAKALAAAEFVLTAMRPEGGPLHHTWRAGVPRIGAFLVDYSFLIRGLLELRESTGEDRWLSEVVVLTEELEDRLGDPRGGYFVAAPDEEIPFRSKEIFDGALPSANGITAQNLLKLAEVTGEGKWLRRAEKSIAAFSDLLAQRPEAVKSLLVAARRYRQMQGGREKPTPSEGMAVASESAFDLQQEARDRLVTELVIGEIEDQGWRPFQLELRIAEGWHLSGTGTESSGAGPKLIGRRVEIRDLQWPEAEWLRPTAALEAIPVYAGCVRIGGRLRSQAGPPCSLLLEAQLCDHRRCLPVTRFEVPLPTADQLPEADRG